jgi:hypothetical protein
MRCLQGLLVFGANLVTTLISPIGDQLIVRPKPAAARTGGVG